MIFAHFKRDVLPNVLCQCWYTKDSVLLLKATDIPDSMDDFVETLWISTIFQALTCGAISQSHKNMTKFSHRLCNMLVLNSRSIIFITGADIIPIPTI